MFDTKKNFLVMQDIPSLIENNILKIRLGGFYVQCYLQRMWNLFNGRIGREGTSQTISSFKKMSRDGRMFLC